MCKNISNELYSKVYKEIKRYIENFMIYNKIANKHGLNSNDILFFCSQLFNSEDLEEYQKEFTAIIRAILKELKENLNDYIGTNVLYGPQIIGGIGQIAFSVSTLSCKTGNLSGFSHSLNQLLLDMWTQILDDLKYQPMSFGIYDAVSGMSGALYYLLGCSDIIDDVRNQEKLKSIIGFLITNTKDYDYNGTRIIKFHVKKEQQYLGEEQEAMPNGHINFGVAHGIMGPLLSLAKASFLKYEMSELEESIFKLLNLYEKFMVNENGILKSPKKISFESYVNEKNYDLSVNSGWCYGNLGVLRGLMKVSKYMNDNKRYDFYKNELLKIINQPIEVYNLSDPIVCHGYGSVVSVQMSSFKETGDCRFLEMIERNVLVLLKAHIEELTHREYYQNDVSLLLGSGGTILTFMGVISMNLDYCKVMLID